MAKIAVIGAGSWGTALAIQLARANHDISLWSHLEQDILQLQQDRENRQFLPGIKLADNIQPIADLAECVADADEILLVIPSHAFASLLNLLRPLVSTHTRISWATKGLDSAKHELLSEVFQQLFPDRDYAIVSGPTFAGEVANGLPTALVVASTDPSHGEQLSAYLGSGAFRPYTSSDPIGVQVGGAAKNVMAIAAGISDGLGFGANSRAALITRGLAEISRLGTFLGGQPETFMGLAGLGDLVLTCTDNQSRNRRFGLALAGGASADQAKQEIGQEVEGYLTTREIYLKSQALGIEMPITEQTYRVLYEGLAPSDAVRALLSRQTRSENDLN